MFLLSQNDENQSENGPKNSKIRLRARPPAEPQKKMSQTKNWGQKVEKHGFFSLFACRFWTGAFTNRCLPYCFLQCFLKASVTTYQKQEVLAEKWDPPGKPVTFYECHPDDHAPAPSVRADFSNLAGHVQLQWELMPTDAGRSLEKIYDQHADPLSMAGSISTGQSKPPKLLSRTVWTRIVRWLISNTTLQHTLTICHPKVQRFEIGTCSTQRRLSTCDILCIFVMVYCVEKNAWVFLVFGYLGGSSCFKTWQHSANISQL